jgi:hypothetical protein
MARPKGSKNKTADAVNDTEFNYDDSDFLYQQVMTNGATDPDYEHEMPMEFTGNLDILAADIPAAEPIPPAVVTSTTFFVEGKVRLDQDGNAPVFADQRRIVNAANVDEALSKFVNYFTNMSNQIQRYTVVQAAASETIL